MSNPNMMRGATPTPLHILMALPEHEVIRTAPLQFGIVPSVLNVWGNQQFGDCVSAEEAFAKAVYALMCGLPEIFITAADVIAWARRNGFLNGADLVEVMDAMARAGMAANGQTYNDGPTHTTVDYTDETVLQNAIASGPIKIAIDANALPSSAGNANGWYSLSGKRYSNTDHCVGHSMFGRADYIYDLLKVPLPAAISPSTPGYGLFTWGTIGFVTHDWILGTCTEAHLRTPTTMGMTPVVNSPLDWLI